MASTPSQQARNDKTPHCDTSNTSDAFEPYFPPLATSRTPCQPTLAGCSFLLSPITTDG
uniref:Uncharacterized protein n=1 Tax=Arundo donax TaxID=35708 RepID=A0A0A8ZIF4_ARUDO